MWLVHAASRLTEPSLSVLVANGVTDVMVPAENSFREGGDGVNTIAGSRHALRPR